MKKIEAYETEDDMIFIRPADAEAHEQEIRFNKWYADDVLGHVGGTGAPVVREWLWRNRDRILEFLNAKP